MAKPRECIDTKSTCASTLEACQCPDTRTFQEFDARAAAAHYHTKWPRGNSQFQHPAGIKPMSHCYYCSVPSTTKP